MTTNAPNPIELDAAIIGAGVAGLWTLDALTRAGFAAVLIEKDAVARGQTMWSQGILHSGLKYTLAGSLTGAARAISDLPERWDAARTGAGGPDLTGLRLRAEHCYLWRTESLASKLGMIGAKAGLKTKPIALDDDMKPAVLRACPGTVARLDEVVLCPWSLASELASAHAGRVLRTEHDIGVALDGGGAVGAVTISTGERTLTFAPRFVVITAGNGAAELREKMDLPSTAMQVRPLRMTLLRGPLPLLNGHCVDGNKTRVTITSDRIDDDTAVWQIGGEVAEIGHSMTAEACIVNTRNELLGCVPGLDTSKCHWATYLAPRAEGRTKNGRRPENPTVLLEKNVITAWPSKLVAAPLTADLILEKFPEPSGSGAITIDDWPTPEIARLPWDGDVKWIADADAGG
ncbi:MAG: FAD-dependent oxidoreductase [Phycisphaerales bacterium]